MRGMYETRFIDEASWLVAMGSPFPELRSRGKYFDFVFEDADGEVEWLAEQWKVTDTTGDGLAIPARKLLKAHQLVIQGLQDARRARGNN
jgi:hypothetical protein